MKTRQQEIVNTGYVGICTNVLVAAGKAIIGLVSGSMAVLLDAVNNVADVLSSIITIIGVKLAGLPADDKHPFGYGRIEYFTAVIVAVLIIIAGVTSLIESIGGILKPGDLEFSVIGLIILSTTVAIKYFLGVYTKRKGKALSSDALISSGEECMFDCIVSLATIVSAIVMILTDLNIDAWLAAIIACLIIKAGVEMLMSPVNELLGKANDQELTNAIKQKVNGINGVRGTYDVLIHNYGPEQNLGALHVEVDDTLTASDLHVITRNIQTMMRHEFGMFVTVGFYAHNSDDSDAAKEEARIREHVTHMDGVLGMHGFYVNHSDKILSFDIVYSFKIHQPLTLRQEILDWLSTDYPGYDIYIGLDRNYNI